MEAVSSWWDAKPGLCPAPEDRSCPSLDGDAWIIRDRCARFLPTDLVGAPVPDGLDGEAENEARPRQIPRDRVPEQVEGIGPRLVTRRVKTGGVGGDGVHVELLEVLKAAHFGKSWRLMAQLDQTHPRSNVPGWCLRTLLPKPMRMKDPTIMMMVCKVSV